jgi:integrase
LYLRRSRKNDRGSVWVILDGQKEVGTGASAHDRARAEKALQEYLAKNHRPPRGANSPEDLLVAEVMSIHLREHAPTTASAYWIGDMSADILAWWGERSLAEVNARNCRAYVAWRTAQPPKTCKHKRGRQISETTARNELIVLRAAINYYHREHGPLQAVPVVTLPPRKPPRVDYFLSRSEIAALIRAARRYIQTRHMERLILVGLYSGTRPGAMLKLRWLPSSDGGWIDLDNEVIHRRSQDARRTKKRQPPVRIHKRLLPHLRRWQREDAA